MAKATFLAVPAVRHINLQLSQDEAQTMRTILNFVGGSPTESRRKHASAVTAALQSLGVIQNVDDVRGQAGDRGIYFNDLKT
jgi:hypothetical protein